MLKSKVHHLDYSNISKYFSLEMTLNQIFRILEDIFSLFFEEVTLKLAQYRSRQVATWHKDVKIYIGR